MNGVLTPLSVSFCLKSKLKVLFKLMENGTKREVYFGAKNFLKCMLTFQPGTYLMNVSTIRKNTGIHVRQEKNNLNMTKFKNL